MLSVPGPEPDPEPEPKVSAADDVANPEVIPEPAPERELPHGDVGPEPSRGGASGGLGETVGRWTRWAYGQVDYQVLCRKREVRLAELGGRVHDLASADRLDDVTGDEGVRRILSQVDEVDAAIATNRQQSEDLREG